MTTVVDMLKRFQKVELLPLTVDAMEEVPDQIVDLNREQTKAGIKSDGTQIGNYHPLSIETRRDYGRQTSYVDLYLTGEYDSKKYLKITGTDFSIPSTDWKRDKLVDQYSDKIEGLTSENKRSAWHILSPYIVRAIKRITGAL